MHAAPHATSVPGPHGLDPPSGGVCSVALHASRRTAASQTLTERFYVLKPAASSENGKQHRYATTPFLKAHAVAAAREETSSFAKMLLT